MPMLTIKIKVAPTIMMIVRTGRDGAAQRPP
jgi:hypothetical protein